MKMKQEGFGKPFVFVLLVAILILAAGFALWYHANAKVDAKTTADAKVFANELNNSISGYAYIPYNLHIAYPFGPISGNPRPIPSTVSYAKLNYTSYKVCIAYRTGTAPTNTTPDTTKLVIPDAHGRGQNCQVIHPYVDPIQISGSLRICDQMVNKDNSADTENSGYISTITANVAGKRDITLDQVVNGVAGPFSITNSDKVYDANCTSLSASALKIGQPLYIFTADNGHHLLLQEKLTWH